MRNIKYVLYINDDTIFLLDRKKEHIYRQQCKYLKEDEIQNEHKFYFEWHEFLRKNKIRVSLFGHKLHVLIKKEINQIQQEKLKDIFMDFFQKVNFCYVEEILPLSKNTAIFNINDNYIDYYYLKKNEPVSITINKNLFSKKDFKAITFVVNSLFRPEKIILFGNSSKIPNLTSKINKELKIQCTYQEEYNTYVLNEYIKRNTHKIK